MSHDDDMPTRDSSGRWLRGYCPNPSGRPKSRPKRYSDQSDVHIFGNTLVEVKTRDGEELMDRRSALLRKMYETAMTGKVSMQRYLDNKFEKSEEQLAAARTRYDQLVGKWIIDNPAYLSRESTIPFDVRAEMAQLAGMLHHYYPYNYPDLGGSIVDDGDDD